MISKLVFFFLKKIAYAYNNNTFIVKKKKHIKQSGLFDFISNSLYN